MATHSSILAWEIPWTEEPDGLWSTELQRVGHDLVTKQELYIHTHTNVCITEALCCTAEINTTL